MLKTSDLLDLSKTVASELFEGCEYPWQALGSIKSFILKLGETLPADKFEKRGDDIWVAKSANVYPSAFIAVTSDAPEPPVTIIFLSIILTA